MTRWTRDERTRLIAQPEFFTTLGELRGANVEHRFVLALLATENPLIPNHRSSSPAPPFVRDRKCCFLTCLNRAKSVDTSMAACGLPVVRDHILSTNTLVGDVERTWTAKGKLWGVLRIGRTQPAEEVWRMLEDNLPLGVSAAFQAISYEELPDLHGTPHYLVTRRRLTEVSIVICGADEHARCVAYARDLGDLVPGEVDAMRAAAARDVLKAKAWSRWARAAGKRIAREVAVDAAHLTVELIAETEQHIEKLVKR